MQSFSIKEQLLIAKLRQLTPSLQIEAENFIDFLSQHRDDRDLVLAAAQLSESTLAHVWDNPDDAAYDNL